MSVDHCPLCKSKKLFFINPFDSRKKLKTLLSTCDTNNLPDDIKKMINVLDLDKEISEDEREFYEIHGNKVICQNCSLTFYENDDMSALEETSAKEVSRDEYIDHLRDLTDDQSFIDFVISKTATIPAYYLETLDILVKEYNEAFGNKKETLVN